MDSLIINMISQAHQMLKQAYTPYSQFKVACCIQTDKGSLYTGTNIENASYGLTLCAEASAISAMVTSGERHIKNVVLLTESNELCSPCGACRQRIHEFSTPDTMVHLCNEHSILHSLTIKELLPLAFNFNP
jgi:cytidine deaminase